MTITSPDIFRLKDILALPPLLAVEAKLLNGTDQLDKPIRWVHVVDTPRGGELIDGGELLLTTGASLGSTANERRRTIAKWVDAGASALLLEIGVVLKELPPDVLDQCTLLGLPLIVTSAEVRFLEVTEAVHSAILDIQFQQVEQLQRINESFWGLMYNGAPPEQLLLHTSRELSLPVVLEDLNHRVILYAEGHFLPSRLLQGWESKSRRWAAATSAAGLVADPLWVADPDDPAITWSFIDVQAQGQHWGRLFVRGSSPDDIQVLHTMRHAAMALAIERLGSAHPNAWTDLRERMGLQRLLKHRFTTVEGQKSVLAANGFHTDGRILVAAEIRGKYPQLTATSVREALLTISPELEVMSAHHEDDKQRIVCVISADSREHTSTGLITSCQVALEHLGLGLDVVVVVAGLHGPIDLSSALHRISFIEPNVPTTGVSVRWAEQNHIDGLVHYLHQDVRVQSFGEATLQPLLIHDERNGTDLVLTLRKLLEYPTSRSAAAQDLHVSRTALYSRIATIERLLSIDLNNGEEFFGLSIAVRSYFGI